jgi:hypothetical protein
VRLVHGSSPNPSNDRRIGFATHYIPTTVAQLVCAFAVGKSAAAGRARVASDELHTLRMDRASMLLSIVDQNPLVWMAGANGLLVDLRDAAGGSRRSRLRAA